MTGPADEPIFNEADAAPMPPEPVEGNCPHCGAAHRSSRQRQQDGDYGVCATCFNTLIFDAGDWRTATFDEAFLADQDARVQIMKAAFRLPLPGPGDNGEHVD
jgi:hypothetical protein